LGCVEEQKGLYPNIWVGSISHRHVALTL